MSVLELCRTVRSQWKALSRLVWPEDTRQLTHGLTDRLAQNLAWRYRRLVARRQRIEKVRDRLARHQRRLDRNPALPSLRAAVERNRILLSNLEAVYARQRGVFLQRKSLHKALVSGQVVLYPLPETDRDPT